ncbi:MAG: helix-turn-helix domain-containing protein [Chloroflexi bacterium]|nr:helix-turn-helix domain-containing protein [Chloroflexota bacterium]
MMASNGHVKTEEAEQPKESPGAQRADRLLRVQEAAVMLGVHPNTVRIWCDSGLLKAFRLGPRRDRRVSLEAVIRLLQSD